MAQQMGSIHSLKIFSHWNVIVHSLLLLNTFVLLLCNNWWYEVNQSMSQLRVFHSDVQISKKHEFASPSCNYSDSVYFGNSSNPVSNNIYKKSLTYPVREGHVIRNIGIFWPKPAFAKKWPNPTFLLLRNFHKENMFSSVKSGILLFKNIGHTIICPH